MSIVLYVEPLSMTKTRSAIPATEDRARLMWRSSFLVRMTTVRVKRSWKYRTERWAEVMRYRAFTHARGRFAGPAEAGKCNDRRYLPETLQGVYIPG